MNRDTCLTQKWNNLATRRNAFMHTGTYMTNKWNHLAICPDLISPAGWDTTVACPINKSIKLARLAIKKMHSDYYERSKIKVHLATALNNQTLLVKDTKNLAEINHRC